MKPSIETIRRFALFGACLALSALLTTAFVFGQSADNTPQDKQTQSATPWWKSDNDPKLSYSPVETFSTHTVIPATGTMLIRQRDDVFATMHTVGLTPGTVVSFWWVFFNNPQNCAARPCTPADLANPAVRGSVASGGGKLIGLDGTASFGSFRAVGDTTGVFSGLGTAEGLLDALKAEIHFVARTHGPALLNDPALFNQQLTLFNGGCPPNTCANVQASIHRP